MLYGSKADTAVCSQADLKVQDRVLGKIASKVAKTGYQNSSLPGRRHFSNDITPLCL